MPCRVCGANVPTSICVDCFAVAVKEHQPPKPPYIEEVRLGGDMIETGVLHALFEDMPAAEVTCCSGAQSSFDAARRFIKEMVENQCKLAGCLLSENPYGLYDVHTEKCWYTKRAEFYRKRNERSVLEG